MFEILLRWVFFQGGFLPNLKGRFFDKVGFCNIFKVGVLSKWNLQLRDFRGLSSVTETS